MVKRGEYPFRNPSSRLLELVVSQTAPAVINKQKSTNYEDHRESRLSRFESALLLGDSHQRQSRSPSPVGAPPLRALFIAPVIAAVLNYSLLALSDISFLAILPIYLASTPLSLTPRAIGALIGGMGMFSGILQVFCTAKLIDRWGAKRVYQVSICAIFPLWALFPIAVSVATRDDTDRYPWSLWFLAFIGLILVAAMYTAYSEYSKLDSIHIFTHSLTTLLVGALFLFIRSAAPTPAALGATNGLSQTMASFTRAIGPACATSVYAASKEHGLLGGNLVYIVLLVVNGVTVWASFLLPEM